MNPIDKKEVANTSLYYRAMELDQEGKDHIEFEDFSRHCLALGATGSGKTSGWGKDYLRAMMKAGCGGLILTVKKDEVEFVKSIAKLEGRYEDVLELNLDGNYCFNFLEYALERAKKSGSSTPITQVLNLFKNVISMQAGSSDVTDNKDAFWIGAMEELLGHIIRILVYSNTEVSIKNMYTIAAILPEDKDSWSDYELGIVGKSFFFQVFKLAEEEIDKIVNKDDNKVVEWGNTSLYFKNRLSGLDIKTKATIVQMFSGMANQLMEGGIRKTFASGVTNIFPEQTFEENKIIIVNIPYLEEGENARLCQVIFKYCWQKAVEKRVCKEDDKFVFLYCDEAQYFVTRNDPTFLSVARSAKCCVCYLTQNINGLARFLGFNAMNLHSFLGNFQLQVFHQNGDWDTNNYASKLIGKTKIKRLSTSKTKNREGDINDSETLSDIWEEQLQPIYFSTLKSGGLNNDYIVEVVIWLCGRVWNNGKNYYLSGSRQKQ